MKMKLRSLIAIAIIGVMAVASQARGAEEQDESLGAKIKKFFVHPMPTPAKPRQESTTKKKKKPTPSPSRSPKGKEKPSRSPKASPSPSRSPSPSATASPSPSAAASVQATEKPSSTPSPATSGTAAPQQSVAPTAPSASPRRERSQSLEPVRPINPAPPARPRATPSPVAEETTSPPPKPTATPSPKPPATPSGKPTSIPNATISLAEISGYESSPPEIRKIIDRALSLTTQNLGYKYGSADPANGGMDCSGFIYYVLSQSGLKDVPRDAREQYVWVRKGGNFQAVLAHRDDTFELDALKPGDLLFWTGTYSINRDPDITHTMIYLGREKTTSQRIMVGASDGRTYKGQSRFGVSVFDFKVSRLGPKSEKQPGAVFVGYGRIPGLRAQ
jgi:cell wall-associated NlpC family hydrolase